MSKQQYKNHKYEVYDNGYKIFNFEDRVMLTQLDPFGKIYNPEGSYEDNAKLHIDSLEEIPPTPDPSVDLPEKNRADIEYMALMLDVDLPSDEEFIPAEVNNIVEEEGE